MAVADYGSPLRWGIWKNRSTGRWVVLPPDDHRPISRHDSFDDARAAYVADSKPLALAGAR